MKAVRIIGIVMLTLVIVAIASLAALVVVTYWAATYLLRRFTSVRLPWPTRFEHLISPSNWLGDEHSKYVWATLGLAALAMTAIVNAASGDDPVEAARAPVTTVETHDDSSESARDADTPTAIAEATPEDQAPAPTAPASTAPATSAPEGAKKDSREATAVLASPKSAQETAGSGPDHTSPAVVEHTTAMTIKVTEVVDGDTIDTTQGRIRMLGYDTPERGECGYQEATDTLTYILASGAVTITSDNGDDTDRYGRLLRHVLVDGTPVGLTMIEQGKADARYDSLDGYPRHQYQNEYRDADDSNTFTCAVATPAPAPTPTTTPTPAPAPTPASAPAPAPTPAPTNNGPFANCDAVRAAGRAPIYAGEPGFESKFDRDGDGIGCE